jgi:SecD/SecF fusion protein
VKKNRFRILLIIGFLALAGYFLYPTWRDSQLSAQLRSLTSTDSLTFAQENEEAIRNARANRLKLGLDLQGGMYVTLEVNIGELLEKLAKNKDDKFRSILEETRSESSTSDEPIIDIFRRKFDEQGVRMSRYYFDIRNSNDEIAAQLRDESEKAVDRAMEIIRNRIDKYGVAEVSIARTGNRRIVVELPGVSDEREVRSLLQETALLEFKLMADPVIGQKTFDNINRVLSGKPALAALDTAAADTAKADSLKQIASADSVSSAADSLAEATMTDEQKAAKWAKENPFSSMFVQLQDGRIFADAAQKERINSLMSRSEIRNLIPPDISFAWSAKPMKFTEDNKDFFEFYLLKGAPELTGEVIENAQAQTDQQGFGGAVVTMDMSTEGAREWARITGANVDKQIAIVLDDAVFSAPRVKQKIIGGRSQIDGMENMDEARLLEIVLKAGALPAPVDIIEERTVGPSLGEDSISKGINSFLIGLGLVVFFMIIYYRYAGLTSNIAVVFNIIFILGILAAFHATLTLPGIAGMLLTVGMAVDANVLINERIREEFGMGKTLRAAIDAGYSRAMPAIIDSNLTTIITCIILYQLGSGPIQGFALTLMIGIISSMFSAIVMTRVIMDVTMDSKPNLVSFG